MKIRVTLLDADTRRKLEAKGVYDKAADAELVLEEGDLAGFRLAGFQVWDHRNGKFVRPGQGEIEVTLPSRSYQGRNGNHFFNHLRPMVEHATEALDVLKAQIVACYRETAGDRAAAIEGTAVTETAAKPATKAKRAAPPKKGPAKKTRPAARPRMRRSVKR